MSPPSSSAQHGGARSVSDCFTRRRSLSTNRALESAYFVVARRRKARPLTPPQHGGAQSASAGKSEFVRRTAAEVDYTGVGHLVEAAQYQRPAAVAKQLVVDGKTFKSANGAYEINGLLHRRPRPVRGHGQDIDTFRNRL